MYCVICDKRWDDCECASEGQVFTGFHEEALVDPMVGQVFVPQTQEDLQQEAVRIKALQLRQLKEHLGLMR